MAEKTVDCTMLAPGRGEGTLRFGEFALNGTDRTGQHETHDPGEELRRFRQHAEAVCRSIRQDIDRLQEKSGTTQADILRGHASILEDEEFHNRVEGAIREMELAAEDAVEHVLQQMADLFAESDNAVFQQRAADFRDLKLRLQGRLEGSSTLLGRVLESTETPVIVVSELYPSMVLEARSQGGAGFITETGTSFAHAAILAKASGLPVARVGALDVLRPYDGSSVLLDGNKELILINPSVSERRPAAEPVTARADSRADGAMKASLWLNVTEPEQLQGRDWGAARGVGLYRTEALFMSKAHGFPSEEEQLCTYRQLFDYCGERPVTVRTVDIGGDKPIRHMTFGPQENPQLGLRAHRLYRYHPELLITQIRAILRAARPSTHLRILYPLVETLEQWDFIQELTQRAIDSLERDGEDLTGDFATGALIETPSAVWECDRFARRADFVSVGTNDLVQYIFGVDRNNANSGFIYQPEHPVVLKVLRKVQASADDAGCPLTVCGEIAGNQRYLPLLIGLGVKNLSVTPSMAEELEATLRSVSTEPCRELAESCLGAGGMEEVRNILDEWHGTPRREKTQVGGAVDPVCKMTVDPEEAPFTLEVDGMQYYFCSRHCLKTFRRSPRT